MDYYNTNDDDDDDDDHDEDDLPEVSLPTSYFPNNLSNNHNEQDNHQSNKSLENWKNLYETSVNSLQSDEDEQKSTSQKPFYLQRQISNEQLFNSERPDSPLSELEVDSNINKSKWQIRLPELLNSTVGPDRQNREVSRRHTTDIVFQQSLQSNPHSLETNGRQPMSPLVRQLKQKFDGMSTTTTNNSTSNNTKNSFHIPKYQRYSSLTTRGLVNNTGQRSRPALPIRPTAEITPTMSRSGSIGSVNSQTSTTTRKTTINNRNHRDKPGPPVSYPKHCYPPPSTASVVKQVIGSGGTLIYDSKTQKSSIKIKPLIKHQTSLEQTREDLKNTNSLLTGRQLLPDNKKNKINQNESNEKYHEPLQNSTRSRSIDVHSNHRRNTNGNEREPSDQVYYKYN